MKRYLLWTILLGSLSTFNACKKDPAGAGDDLTAGSKKISPDGFNFSTLKTVDMSLRLLTPNNKPIKGAIVTFLVPGTTAANGVLFKAASDVNGFVKGTFSVPSYLDTLVVEPNYVGLLTKAKVLVSGSSIIATIGGDKGYSGSIIPEATPASKPGQGVRVLYTDVFTGINFLYPLPYTNSADATHNNGVPNYLETTPDVIDPALLSFINTSLPNGQSVAVHHPQYLNSPAATIDIVGESDVAITFVSEGADYRNSLGYYTYPTGNPPTAVSQVSTVKMVFPNASQPGSGGNLSPGDKVKIGHFSAGTSIGFVLLQDAWTGSDISFNRSPTDPTLKFFSTAALNTENSGDPAFTGVVLPKKHTVMMFDNIHHLFLFGFEDTQRTNRYVNPGNNEADHDFNDLLFYATPEVAFDHTNVPLIDGGGDDTDGDGIPDPTDEFPTDPLRAYTQTTIWSTLAFEDLWPSTGDYDMNDVVVKYRYKYVKNAQNDVVEFYGQYQPLAAGANYRDGFGVEFPFPPSIVESVTGQRAPSISFAANGVESGQPKAVIFPFDNYINAIHNADANEDYINTVMAKDKVVGDLVEVKVKFNTAVPASTVGDVSTYNPFITVKLNRQVEVHLPGMPPTAKANMAYLGTFDDDTNPSLGKYYKTANQWPWAINIAGTFLQPTEGSAINTAYLHFLDWAQAGGNSYADWYLPTDAGYRNLVNIYTK